MLLEAEDDLKEIVHYYNKKGHLRGKDFAREFQQKFHLIAALPDLYASGEYGFRQCYMKSYPYWIIYIESPEEIVFIAVSHAKRQQEYWITRLENDNK